MTALCGWSLPSVVGYQPFWGKIAQLKGEAIPPQENKSPKKDNHHQQEIVTIHRGRSLTSLPP